MAEWTLHLDGDSLLSKWGFGDGDCVFDYWWDAADEAVEFDHHAALRLLVHRHLIPAIEAAGHTITVYNIETSHNPIRADMLDGEPVDDYANRIADLPSVEVTLAEVRRAVADVSIVVGEAEDA